MVGVSQHHYKFSKYSPRKQAHKGQREISVFVCSGRNHYNHNQVSGRSQIIFGDTMLMGVIAFKISFMLLKTDYCRFYYLSKIAWKRA